MDAIYGRIVSFVAMAADLESFLMRWNCPKGQLCELDSSLCCLPGENEVCPYFRANESERQVSARRSFDAGLYSLLFNDPSI
jgi:hypothetical protein